jgi:hypothetical protein
MISPEDDQVVHLLKAAGGATWAEPHGRLDRLAAGGVQVLQPVVQDPVRERAPDRLTWHHGAGGEAERSGRSSRAQVSRTQLHRAVTSTGRSQLFPAVAACVAWRRHRRRPGAAPPSVTSVRCGPLSRSLAAARDSSGRRRSTCICTVSPPRTSPPLSPIMTRWPVMMRLHSRGPQACAVVHLLVIGPLPWPVFAGSGPGGASCIQRIFRPHPAQAMARGQL